MVADRTMTRGELANAILAKVQGEAVASADAALTLDTEGGILLGTTTTTAPTVLELLSQSRAQHLAYRSALPRRDTQGTISEGKPEEAVAALREAGRLRAQAELADPDHADPAWLIEPMTHNHDELLNFYYDLLHR
jgi:hypothetical protein